MQYLPSDLFGASDRFEIIRWFDRLAGGFADIDTDDDDQLSEIKKAYCTELFNTDQQMLMRELQTV